MNTTPRHTTDAPHAAPSRPATRAPFAPGPMWLWIIICALIVGVMGYLRLVLFPDQFVPLASGVPLLLFLWRRDMRLLLPTSLGLLIIAIIKVRLMLPPDATLSTLVFDMMQTVNIVVPAAVIGMVIRLSSRLDQTFLALERTNAELEAGNEELAAREEEISQQNEELQSQATEVEQQVQELSAQAEELQTLNEQLAGRERTLNDLIESSLADADESSKLERFGEAVSRLLGSRAAAAAVLETNGDELTVHPLFGIAPGLRKLRREQTLADIVMSRDRAGFLADRALRPDLETPGLSEGGVVRSLMAAPLRSGGAYQGAIEVYSTSPGEWSEDELRLCQWIAGQCGKLWSNTRLRAELVEQQQLLRTVANNTTVAVFMLDDDLRCTYINTAAERLTGYTLAEVQSRPFSEYLRVRTPDGAFAQPAIDWERERAEGRVLDDVEFRRAADWFAVRCAITPSKRRGDITGFIVEIMDITAQKQAARERETLLEGERSARGLAERANRAKDEFVATLSHELRTPLNAIMGWATLLRRNPSENAEVNKGLEIIERNARHQSQLISDLLDISRITAGKIRLDIQPMHLPLVIEAALEAVGPAAEAKGVTLVRNFEPIENTVTGDAARLQQVMWNLLTNAVKFTPRDGRVEVSVSRAGPNIKITVSDTGQGIDPDVLPQLFERYRQGDSSSTRRQGGLGLGLAIVKHLIELHGGTVSIHSDGPNRGAVCHVLLPVCASDAADSMSTAPSAAVSLALTVDPTGFAGMNILLVDDEPDALDLVHRLLSDRGASVQTAASAREALSLFEQSRPHLLISDIGMPGMDGYTLVRQVRERWPETVRTVPAIAVTAFARSEDRTRALVAGFQSHIAKPIEPAELIATISSLRSSLPSNASNPPVAS